MSIVMHDLIKKTLLPICFLITCHLANGQTDLTLERIFTNREFSTEWLGQKKWIDNGEGYTALEQNESSAHLDIVRYETSNGNRTVLIPAGDLIPAGRAIPLKIENYEWSFNKSFLLIYTNSKRVWRYNTRGDYWIKNLTTGNLFQLGTNLPESSLMFAKFSPDDQKVAYVSGHNIYVEDLVSHEVRRLTFDGTDKIINGTFDWAYEEEFFCRDGFRWSPDGKKIAFWQLDATGIRNFLMINNTDSTYAYTIPVQYPKVGADNSSCRIGVITLDDAKITWMKISDDTKNNYLPTMQWANNSEQLLVQRLNRHQNTNHLTLCHVETGRSDVLYTEQDEAWLDVVENIEFINNGESITWTSEKSGWRSLYKLPLSGKKPRLITTGTFDLMSIALIDEQEGWAYYLASPDNATQQYLYRSRIGSKKPMAERITPNGQPGFHAYDISPDGKWAFHTRSQANNPPVHELISLPDHKTIRIHEDNQILRKKLSLLTLSPVEFFSIETEPGLTFDCYMIKPKDFDSTKTYPVMFHVYGEPAAQTVTDRWGGSRYFYHQFLANQGYLVMSIDNRGTPGPKGREWRKSIYAKLGVISSEDQAAVTKKILDRYSFIDKNRVGIWGWSGGGSMTLNMLFRYPEVYKMGISVAPVTDIRLYDNIYQERYCGLLSEKEQEYFNSSPVNFAKNLKGDLLLIHGTGDDNVHYQNTEVLINELIRHNKIFSLMSYPNRSHGIYEGSNTIRHLYETMWDYIQKNL